MGAAICMKLSCLTRACVHVCACVHVRAHVWGAPPNHPPPLEPQGAQNTKIQ